MRFLHSIRNRLIAGMFLLLTLFLVLAGIGIGSLRSIGRTVDEQFALLNTSSLLATELIRRASAQVRVGEAYLMAPTEALRQEFIRLGDTTHALRRYYRPLAGLTPRDQATLNRMAAQHAALEVAYSRAHALADLGRRAEALHLADSTRGGADSLIATVGTLVGNRQVMAQQQATLLRQHASEREALVWLLLSVAVVLGFATAYLIVRSIDSPLQTLIAAAQRFGSGDLRPTDNEAMPMELVTLAHSMGTMGARLRGMIDATVGEARAISGSAGDLSAMSEQVAASSHEIVRSISSVTSDAGKQVREVRGAESLLARLLEASGQDVAATERVVALGESTRLLAAQQGRAVQEAGRAVTELRTALQRAATEAGELGRNMEAVAAAAEVADQLAAQSEVLALNAAVEASRHPAAALGFSAVAEETRRLAGTSRAAADRVGGTVHQVRVRASALMAVLQGSAAQVLATETSLQRSAVAFQEIGRLVDAMRDIATRVARSAEESRETAARFAELRARLEGIAQENVSAGEAVTAAATQQSEATEDIASSAASLLEASQRLANLVAGFRT